MQNSQGHESCSVCGQAASQIIKNNNSSKSRNEINDILQARRPEVFLYLLAVIILKDFISYLYVSYNLKLASYISELKEEGESPDFRDSRSEDVCSFAACTVCPELTSYFCDMGLLCLTTNKKFKRNVRI